MQLPSHMSIPNSQKCSSNAGCDYTIPAAMTKDEWRNSTFKVL